MWVKMCSERVRGHVAVVGEWQRLHCCGSRYICVLRGTGICDDHNFNVVEDIEFSGES